MSHDMGALVFVVVLCLWIVFMRCRSFEERICLWLPMY